jgi:hypothetical protein
MQVSVECMSPTPFVTFIPSPERIKKWEQQKEDKTFALHERMSNKEEKISSQPRKKQRQDRDLVRGALKDYRDGIDEVRREAGKCRASNFTSSNFSGSLRAATTIQGENTEKKRSDPSEESRRETSQAELERIWKEDEAQRAGEGSKAGGYCSLSVSLLAHPSIPERMRNAKETRERPPQKREAGIALH